MAGSLLPAVVLVTCYLSWTAVHAAFPPRAKDLLPGENEFLSQVVDVIDDLEKNDEIQNKFLSEKFPDFEGGPVVDGGWTDWLPWWPCTQSCGGVSYRFRRCNNPRPSGGGRPCEGEHVEIRPCPPCPNSPYNLRLRDGPRPSAGRVEVFVDERWGTVCDDSFSVEDAKVVCRQLGHTQKTPVVYGMAKFGEGQGPIHMDEIGCKGGENNILECPHLTRVQHNCLHSEDVGVDCDPSDTTSPPSIYQVRLMDGNKHSSKEGRVETFIRGVWGTVCDDNFNITEAIVVCKSLGFTTSSPEVKPKAYYGPGRGPILLDNVKCHGNETSLIQCAKSGIGNHDCSHSEDVGVNCDPGSPTPRPSPYEVRLIDQEDRKATSGRVEVYINGQWGTVCDDRFDINDAIVVCRMLGINTTKPRVHSSAFYGEGSGLILLDELECTGSESNLMQCRSNPPRIHDCLHQEDVSVDCNTTADKIRLSDGPRPSEGRLEVYMNGEWGTVCDKNFKIASARVVCSILGFEESWPLIYSYPHYGQGKGQVHLTDVQCSGRETDLLYCRHSTATDSNCTHLNDVSINCVPVKQTTLRPSTTATTTTPRARTKFDIRLVGGVSDAQGRLEVFINGRWGTVCDDRFSEDDAIVVCRQLGFNTSNYPIVRHHAYYGQGQDPIWLDNVECKGYESDLSQCVYSGQGVHNCDHSEDVGVECEPPPTVPVLPDIKVRLVNGGLPSRGRIELYWHGQWQTMCNESLTDNVARVICTSVGFKSSSPVILPGAFYGSGSGRIFQDDLFCPGSETNLGQCSNFGRGDRHCNHSQDASIDCMPPPPPTIHPRTEFRVRLEGGTSKEGRLEVEIDGQWGTVCDDGFGKKEAIVACRSLGLNSSDPVVRPGTKYGEAKGPIFMDNVKCIGNESNLAKCLYRDGHNCDHREDVGLDCMPSTHPINIETRLVNGTSPSNGRVELYLDGEWQSVCEECFTENVAKVVCRSLGYISSSPIIRRSAYYGRGSGKILEDDWFCIGNETNLGQCINNGSGVHRCNHSQDLGLDCQPKERTEFRVRLEGGTSKEGRLEVEINGQWGTVCDDGFGKKEAIVVCHSLGFNSSDPVVRPGTKYGEAKGPILMDNVKCIGNESNLAKCLYRDGHNCDHREDVGLDCMPSTHPINIETRLVNGTSPSNGRVEVYLDGEWQSVCEECFTENVAKVVCRSLGYISSSPIIRRSAYYGRGSGKILEDDWFCIGNETNLGQCINNGPGVHRCNHSQDLGLDCQPKERTEFRVRLEGGNSKEGRLEVEIDGQWGTVCDDGFGKKEAIVACRSLGINSSDPVVRPGTEYGEGKGPILMDNVKCIGNESNLAKCLYRDGHNCDHREDVGLDCMPSTHPITIETRLVNGTSPSNGRVEVYLDGEWQTVCEECFTESVAKVVCRSLGYISSSPIIRRSAYYGRGSGKILEDDWFCIGNETNLGQCINNGPGVHRCNHSQDVGLDCQPKERTEFRVRLEGGNSKEGRLEVEIDGQWGTVCDDGFGKKEAIVACRSLGFNSSDPVVRPGPEYGEGKGPILMDNVKCIGNESNLAECLYRDGHNCDHREDVGLDCMPSTHPIKIETRLVNGTSPSNGRVELYLDGEWQTVCEECFTENVAKVVCRSLGYFSSSPVIRRSAYYGRGSGKILEDDWFCIGNETNLGQCINNGPGVHRCNHSQDLGLDCQPKERTEFRVRLEGGNSKEGRLEVEIDGQWGTVCNDGFGKKEAIVVCHSLGFNSSSDPLVLPASIYGKAEGPILMDNVMCNGNESSLSECLYKDGHNCDHSEDVGLNCQPKERTEFRVRLEGGTSKEGRLEVEIDGQWGTVCDDGFGKKEAIVACRSLGINCSDPVVLPRAFYGEGKGPILMDNVNCSGNETNLSECLYKDAHNCDHSEDVGLKCMPSPHN